MHKPVARGAWWRLGPVMHRDLARRRPDVGSRRVQGPRWRAWLLGGCVLLAIAGCAVGPDYQRPAQPLGDAYAHAPAGHWRRADAPTASLPQAWWGLFGDPGLDQLMAALSTGNLDVAQAEAQYRQAQAALAASRAGLFPSVDGSVGVTRAGQGAADVGNPATTHVLSASVSWEVDLWGRIRRDVEAARAEAQASGADLAAMRLSMQSTLAQAYFAVRVSQLQDALLAKTLDQYARALQMTRNRYAVGIASPADVAAASTQLDQTRVQRIRLGWQRQQQLHAIAVLLGEVPSRFTLPAGQGLVTPPAVPPGVPSALLLHRPDVVAAERRAAEANARIGVAQAAWFPDFTLNAQAGYRSAEFASWIMAPARFWTLGPTLAMNLFDGGARSAAVRSAQAAYDVQATQYRKTVLDAVREVEDALIQTRSLGDELAAQDRALASARETLRQTTNQYEAGLVDYLSVVQAQTTALSAEQNDLDLKAQRLDATILLIAALGGGWADDEAGAIPSSPP